MVEMCFEMANGQILSVLYSYLPATICIYLQYYNLSKSQ